MEESQESNFSLSKYDGTEDGSLSQYMSINDCEREIQMLERDIRQQKESSANAKTSITFDQLRKIHSASLKNRLKSNINKFEPSTPLSFTQATFDSSQNSLSASESQSFVVTPTTLHNLFNHQRKNQIEMLAPLASEEELMRFPAERQFDLMQIGFSYDEVKQLLEMFDKYKNDVQEMSRHSSLTQVLNQFCNYISMYAPPNLKLISLAFNLLELGNSANEVKRVLLKARRREESEESDLAPFAKKMCNLESESSPNRDELLLGLDRSPPSDDGTQKM
ncbi:Protein CBG21118 [Caenorhabditis briggsae]|uniref:Protein CBG21118 n=1 Tax=Caenorhabditis briggsae TaxID=6238 RepID=A8XZF9_CAEBR|nr:Protein CBG21118 [Caenorhabditis briggsae]CAP38086.2 Protein CBG21118 [Caenorhabditis briggsae]